VRVRHVAEALEERLARVLTRREGRGEGGEGGADDERFGEQSVKNAAALISSSRSASIVCAARHPRMSSLAARSSNTSLAPTTSPDAMRI